MDNILFGPLQANDSIFGVAAATDNREYGILGIGATPEGSRDPPTVLETLYNYGQIKSNVYGLNMRSVNETGKEMDVLTKDACKSF